MPITPNKGRVIVELLKQEDSGQIIIPNRENVKAGENAYIGKIVHPGDSGLKEGQLVMFAEYSMVGFYHDVRALAEGKVSAGESFRAENMHYVVATCDVMAYENDDAGGVRTEVKED